MAESVLPVLLVEDDPLVLESTAEMLSEGGCAVTRATCAGDALAALERGPVPSVVVTDIGLADGRSGLDLARDISARWPEVRLLIVSGEQRPGKDDYPDRALFFTKPYANGALLAMVRGTDW